MVVSNEVSFDPTFSPYSCCSGVVARQAVRPNENE